MVQWRPDYRFSGGVAVKEDNAKHRIIIVEDDPDMQMFLDTLLQENGFDPIIAGSAAEGLELAKDLNPSCFIVNAMVPAEDGVTMYVNLKCDDRLKTVPVIILSTIERRIFLKYHKIHHTQDGIRVPEPEAFIEIPPDSEELLKQLHLLVRG